MKPVRSNHLRTGLSDLGMEVISVHRSCELSEYYLETMYESRWLLNWVVFRAGFTVCSAFSCFRFLEE